jgi:hypothetical protein
MFSVSRDSIASLPPALTGGVLTAFVNDMYPPSTPVGFEEIALRDLLFEVVELPANTLEVETKLFIADADHDSERVWSLHFCIESRDIPLS